MATRKNTRTALADSMRAESDTFKARLEKAEAALTPESPVVNAPVVNAAVAPVAPVHEVPAPPVTPPIEKVVREAFTIPEAEHSRLDANRTRLLKHAIAANKSEIVRAGLLALSEMKDNELVAIFERLERVKTGRPKTG